MKKIFLLLSIVSVFGLTACSNDDDRVDHDTFPEVFDTQPISFIPSGPNRYSVVVPLKPNILSSDVVMVYRRTNDDGFTVWQPIPRTIFLPNGTNPDLEVDYDFNFTTTDVLLYMTGTADLATVPQLTQNQVFRIVLVPGFIAKNLNTNDYDAVMSALEKSKGNIKIETIK